MYSFSFGGFSPQYCRVTWSFLLLHLMLDPHFRAQPRRAIKGTWVSEANAPLLCLLFGDEHVSRMMGTRCVERADLGFRPCQTQTADRQQSLRSEILWMIS